MFQSKSRTSLTNKKTLLFGLISVFLCGMGFSIIMPVVPFLVTPYVTNASDQALMVTLLTSVYAFCVFFAAPGLGALSDRFGRRPVLLICFIGSAIGYFIFGLGGALWVLFLGRIIEGITGGSISTLFAFFADITPQEERTKYFGWVSEVLLQVRALRLVQLSVVCLPTLVMLCHFSLARRLLSLTSYSVIFICLRV